MSKNSNSEQIEQIKKILIMGLDNSGKTSIVMNLIGKSNIRNFVNLEPTKGPDIINLIKLNSKFNIWDLGGQKIYRDEYLKNFNDYIIETEKIIYVIDLQEPERYELALEFLIEIIKKIEKHGYHIDFTFFLHKFDKDLNEIQPNLNDNLINNLIKNIKSIMPSNFFF